MKSFNTELEKHARKVRLRAEERAELRAQVLSYMEYHPLPKEVRRPSAAAPARTFAIPRFVFHTYTRIATGAFAILLIVTAVPFAAERAVPGDILYPVKTGVNEVVRAQFIDSPYEQIAFETELMERRIAEARLLAKEGKLTEAAEAKIAETVREHASAAWAGIAELNSEDAEEGALARITFGSALDVQSAVIDSEEGDAERAATDSIAEIVRAARASVDADTSTTTPSHERLSGRVEQFTTRAYELFASVKDAATEEERTDIERRLSDINGKVLKAQSAYEATPEAEEVRALLIEALGDTQKLISFMTDIDVRESVPLETLVPVVLTPEERLAALRELRTQFVADIETETEDEQNASSTAHTEGEASEVERLAEFDTLLARAEAALAEGNIPEAEVAIDEAEAFAATLAAKDEADDVTSSEEVTEPEEATSTDASAEEGEQSATETQVEAE